MKFNTTKRDISFLEKARFSYTIRGARAQIGIGLRQHESNANATVSPALFEHEERA